MKKFLSTVGTILSIPILFACILLFSAGVVYLFDITGLRALI